MSMSPPVKRIQEAFNVDKVTATKAKKAMQSSKRSDDIMDELNDLLKGYGVEAIRYYGSWIAYYLDIVAEYINYGDTYDTTILYDVDRDRYYITTYGDWIETAENTGRYSFE